MNNAANKNIALKLAQALNGKQVEKTIKKILSKCNMLILEVFFKVNELSAITISTNSIKYGNAERSKENLVKKTMKKIIRKMPIKKRILSFV